MITNDYVVVPVGNLKVTTPSEDLNHIYTLLVYARVKPVSYYKSVDEDGSALIYVQFSAKESTFDLEALLDDYFDERYKIIFLAELVNKNTTAPLICT